MKVETLGLPGVLRLTADVHRDGRGWFEEVHRSARYAELGITAPFVQDNHSHSVRGVVRGLHWQRSHPQGKIVHVVAGAIFDVVADVRLSSPHFGSWVGITLQAGSGDQLWVPPGYAHGFCVLSDTADVLYKCTDVYVPLDGRGVRFDDPDLAIDWPIDSPILSEQDRGWPWLRDLAADDLPGGAP